MLLPRGTQKPTLQNVSVPHCVQTSPPEPQPLSTFPERQAPVAESQQPVQVLVLHFADVGPEQPTPSAIRDRIRRRRITRP